MRMRCESGVKHKIQRREDKERKGRKKKKTKETV
jgi:hypothetical protein